MVDMEEGKLSFAKNGTYLGVAFESNELRFGSLYPAVSFVVPGDSVKIRKLEPED